MYKRQDRAYVERKGVELTLSALEYRLLLLFATNPGKLVSRDMIRDALWDLSLIHIYPSPGHGLRGHGRAGAHLRPHLHDLGRRRQEALQALSLIHISRPK